MNAHLEANSGEFGSSGLDLIRNHRSGAFSTLYDVWTYTWNYRNEMTGFSEKNSSETVIGSGTYTYDAIDRRIGVDETSGGTTTQTWIVYNGNSNTLYAEFNGSGTLLERYLAGPSYVPGVTGMIARTNASGVTDWYLTGKLGSVRDIVDTSGTVIDHISYGAFGSIRAETNPSSGSQFKFDGMQYDTITGLYNDWHRGYSSSNGKFTTQDILSFRGLDSNLYRTCNNNTMNFIDPLGYWYVNINVPIPIRIPIPIIGEHVGFGGGVVIGQGSNGHVGFYPYIGIQKFGQWGVSYSTGTVSPGISFNGGYTYPNMPPGMKIPTNSNTGNLVNDVTGNITGAIVNPIIHTLVTPLSSVLNWFGLNGWLPNVPNKTGIGGGSINVTHDPYSGHTSVSTEMTVMGSSQSNFGIYYMFSLNSGGYFSNQGSDINWDVKEGDPSPCPQLWAVGGWALFGGTSGGKYYKGILATIGLGS